MSITFIEKPKTAGLAIRAEQGTTSDMFGDSKAAELEISRLGRVVWRNSGYVLACAAVCAFAGYGIGRWQTPAYRSSATVELLGVNTDFLNLREVQPNASSNVTGTGESYLQTELELFSSKSLVTRTLSKLGMLSSPSAQERGRLQTREAEANGLVDSYAKRLRVEQVKESNLLQVTFEDKDPGFAAKFANTLVSEAAAKSIEDRWKSNDRLGALFSKQVELLRHRIEAAEQELQSYGRQSGLLYTGENDSVAEDNLKALEEELSRAQAERIQKESRYTLLSAADPNSIPEILGNELLRSYQSKLAELQRERAEFGTALTPENPKMLKVEAQIQNLQATIGRERANVITGVTNDFQAAKQREQLLSRATAAQAGMVSVQAEKAIHYNTLKREVDTTRGLYEAMLRRMNDAQVMSTINSSDIRVVDEAQPALRPSRPNKALYAGLGLINGLFFPLVFLFIKEYRNATIQAPDHIPSLFHALGVIPSVKGSMRAMTSWKDEQIQGALLAPKSDSGEVRRPRDLSRSQLKDSFRGIAASILLRHSHQSDPLTLVVSSPHESEGKTTTVFNVGVEMAAIGRRVLLIDGDLRRPTLHRFFGLENTRGFGTFLRQESSSIDPIQLVKATGIENLSLLPAGAGMETGTGWLNADGLRLLLRQLAEHYDLILIDSAPLLLMPESRMLAKAADGLVLVFRAGKTNYEDAVAAFRQAAQDGTPIFGTVLNDSKPQRNQNHYYARRLA